MIFLHGLESNSQTYKASVIRASFPDLVVPDFTGPLADRMRDLYPILGDRGNWTLIGSSFGGLMAAIFTCERPHQVRKQVLLAPALTLPEFEPFLEGEPVEVPTTIIHGKRDEVVPLEPVHEIAQKVFTNLTHRVVDDDHRLRATTDSLDWKAVID
jgi:pimeloyl-ACP methyl ester carboxylesterase